MTNPEKLTPQTDESIVQHLAEVATNGINASKPRADDWIAIIDYCNYWGLDIPGLPIQGTP